MVVASLLLLMRFSIVMHVHITSRASVPCSRAIRLSNRVFNAFRLLLPALSAFLLFCRRGAGVIDALCPALGWWWLWSRPATPSLIIIGSDIASRFSCVLDATAQLGVSECAESVS